MHVLVSCFLNLVPRFPNRAYDNHLPALSRPAFLRIDPWISGVEIILNGCPIAAKASLKDLLLSYRILIEDQASIVIVIQVGQQFELGITLSINMFKNSGFVCIFMHFARTTWHKLFRHLVRLVCGRH